jgi:sulfur-carrier protein
MKISVKLFAAARQIAGCEAIEVELPDGATVGQLRQAIARQFPNIDRTAEHCLFAVDNQYADNSTPLAPGSEVACIPPVSGG